MPFYSGVIIKHDWIRFKVIAVSRRTSEPRAYIYITYTYLLIYVHAIYELTHLSFFHLPERQKCTRPKPFDGVPLNIYVHVRVRVRMRQSEWACLRASVPNAYTVYILYLNIYSWSVTCIQLFKYRWKKVRVVCSYTYYVPGRRNFSLFPLGFFCLRGGEPR